MTSTPSSKRSSSGRRGVVWTLAVLCALAVLSVGAQQLFIIDFQQDDTGIVENLRGSAGVALSRDGELVFVAGEGDDGLTVFEREDYFGTLTFDQGLKDEEDGVFGLLGVRAVAAAPDNRHVYAVGAFDNSLTVFARDATADRLTFLPAQVQESGVGPVFGMDRPSAVAVSPDSELVVVASELSNSVSVFSQDASTDDLRFVDTLPDAGAGGEYLAGASGLAMAPDNQTVYVTSRIDDSLNVFRRFGDGLSYRISLVNGENGVEGLNGASGVAVSPDGRHVYVASAVDNALVTFQRNGFSDYALVDIERDGVDGVDGIGGAWAVAVNPRGDRVFVAGRNDNAVALFRRDPTSGQTQFLDAKAPPVGLGGVESLAVSPDGAFVYAACYDEDAVTGLYVALCEGNETTGDSDRDAICNDRDTCLGDDFSGDSDSDGVCGDLDVCPGFDDNQDGDGDGSPDGCDLCRGDDGAGDSDSDQVCDDLDQCPGFDDDADGDGDTVPDGCDVCFGDNATGDSDGDAVCNDLDLCRGDDVFGDPDLDGVCSDLDCAPNDPGASVLDACGVCGGDNSSCGGIFFDGFESGTASAWSAAQP